MGSDKAPRRVLHTSDLHLASRNPKSHQSLVALVNLANHATVDLVIIVGDLFDHNQVNDNLVGFVVEQLRALSMPVAILPGNHDCLVPDSVFNRNDFWQGSDNIHVFRSPSGEIMDLPDQGIMLWGKSIDSYERNLLPLEGIPHPQSDGRWHIALAHGYFVNADPPLFPSYHITCEEIINSGWDYVAMGHSTGFQCVCDGPVTAYYSGSPTVSGAVALVDFAEGTGVRVTACPLENSTQNSQ
ncbi:MAG: DNA repair exonuclease [Chloroflexota bacterium]